MPSFLVAVKVTLHHFLQNFLTVFFFNFCAVLEELERRLQARIISQAGTNR